ncbi:type I methionyl aminopeptidase [Angustibacter sp. McL0619]|uniref:type I methionyl aminopeptidase n=1 Tax=Angustibacter sp. McL0619 TaxID=3415676 RepID=UPI003CFAE8C5
MIGRDRIQYKSPDQLRLMRQAGLLVGQTLERLREAAVAGTSTGELDQLAERTIRDAVATPSFLGYGHPPFPATVCISVNDEIVHGVPGARRLQDGDVVSIDCGAILQGWHGDSAISLVVGGSQHADPADTELLRVTEESMWRGIAALAVGERLHAVGAAVEDLVLSADHDYGIVEEYVGHGIGTEMHQDPQVPNYRVRDKGVRVRPGLAVAIEPMLTRGSAQTRVLADDWTVVTLDGSRAAHFEHTVAVTEAGLWVLTALDGGEQKLTELGAKFAPLT